MVLGQYFDRRQPAGGIQAKAASPGQAPATLADLRDWTQFRVNQGAGADAPFICSQHWDALGNALDRQNLRKRFKACCRVLGRERQTELDHP